jgi:hypothetical protein
MIYQSAATAIAILHFAFIVFVAVGGLLVLRWQTLAWFHLPAAIWGAAIEIMQWNCPLTNVENWLLRRAGKEGYDGGFIAHYLFSVIYPAGLTRRLELAIAAFVVIVNTAVYVTVLPPQRIIDFIGKAKS